MRDTPSPTPVLLTGLACPSCDAPLYAVPTAGRPWDAPPVCGRGCDLNARSVLAAERRVRSLTGGRVRLG